MRILLIFFIAFCANLAVFGQSVHGAEFRDDFKGVERVLPDGEKVMFPDAQKWAFTFWPGIKWPDSYGDGTNWLENNGESQTYLNPFLAKVKGSFVPISLRYNPFKVTQDGLHITAGKLSREQMAAYKVDGHRRFGSGMILSRQSFLYGRIDVVAKMPSARGTWPAIWMLPQKPIWPPEIDILEGMAWAGHETQIHSGFVNTKEDGESFSDWMDVGIDIAKDFHTYSLDWTPKTLTMLFDGRVMWQKPTPKSMNQPMYLIINLAVGGKWPYNELDIKPIDDVSPLRLSKGADLIEKDYPAEIVIKSVSVQY